jgi:hypothetical protein
MDSALIAVLSIYDYNFRRQSQRGYGKCNSV